MNKKKSDVFHTSMNFIRKYSHPSMYPVDVNSVFMPDFIGDFKKVFESYFAAQGFDKKNIEILFQWGEYGHNWNKLHPSDAESSRSQEEKLAELIAELHYCSDRMSMDRMFRCHWLFNQFCLQYRQQIQNALDILSR